MVNFYLLLKKLHLINNKDMHEIEKQCPELTEKTAEALDNEVLKGLFITTQRNNLDLCIKYISNCQVALVNWRRLRPWKENLQLRSERYNEN